MKHANPRPLPGSFSGRNGAHGSRTGRDRRTRLEPDINRSDGQFGCVLPLSMGAIRRAIESCTCPWCGKGPFKMLPVHTNKAHGVDKWQLREMAGLTTNDPLCSSEALKAMSDHAKANPKQHLATAALKENGKKVQRWTSAGKQRVVTNLRDWEASNPELAQAHRSASAKNQSAESRKKQAESLRATLAAKRDSRKEALR